MIVWGRTPCWAPPGAAYGGTGARGRAPLALTSPKCWHLSNLLVRFGLVFLRRPLASGPTLSRDVKKCLALASWCARTGGRRPFSEGELPQFAHGCTPTGEGLRGYFLVERNSFRFFPFRWFRLSEPIERRGRNGMNSVLRLPGYGSWGRARTGSWLRHQLTIEDTQITNPAISIRCTHLSQISIS